jgi:Tannase and feruloyl esterase
MNKNKGSWLALVALLAQAPLASAKPCDALKSFRLDGLALTITQTETIPAGPPPPPPYGAPYEGTLPVHCRVTGEIDPRTGYGGTPYAIEFAVSLPEQWNGRFLFQGGGGFNGTLYPPVGSQAVGHALGLARGFAVASTDSGHKGAVFDPAFMQDQEALLDFLYRANDKVTRAAKAIVAAYYGSAAKHSYWSGCSTGGREGMLMSQRFPDYYDGIVAGAPAMRTSFSGLADRWMAVQLNAIAPRDDKGLPVAMQALSDGDRALVHKALLDACDAQDGVADGMIFAIEQCAFDPRALQCKGAKTDTCLTAAQVDAIATGMAGPKDSSGAQVYPPFWYDTGITTKEGIPGLLAGPSALFPETATTLDIDREAAHAANPIADLGDSAKWTLLNVFSSRGGKLIFYHGVSDPWFSAQDTTRYYRELIESNGGSAAVRAWSRLFLVPGMGHCGGGEGLDKFDLLGAVVRWVEEGAPPDAVIADGAAFPGRTRPLCPYPQHAHYTGKGDAEDAGSFECR